MGRPLALDLFCCAGGSAVGLERAGFDVIGVDHKPSQHWSASGSVVRADLSTPEDILGVLRAYRPAFVSASPPCQRFSQGTPKKNRKGHPDLIGPTRVALAQYCKATGAGAWIENVPGAPLEAPIRLCGVMFPETQRVKRHRLFELIGWWTLEPAHTNCVKMANGERRPVICCVRGATCDRGAGNGRDRERREAARRAGIKGQNRPGPGCVRWRRAMGWMDGPKDAYSLSQAIPPAYAEWLGRRFLETR